MKNVLITGVSGFVGQQLAQLLHLNGIQVSGIGREAAMPPNLSTFVTSWQRCDLANASEVNQLDFSKYDAIISLAGLAIMSKSFAEPERYLKVNVDVLKNVCDRLVEQRLSPRIVAVSSGAVYDNTQTMPLTEASKTSPASSPYSKSKLAMEEMLLAYKATGLAECIIARPFNHIGPGQKSGFLVPDMYMKLQRAVETGSSIQTGNLSTRRDYTDVRDVAMAYMLLALNGIEKLTSPVYNVCCGTSRSGNEILNELKKYVPGSEHIEIVTDPSLIRANDPQELVGSNQLINQAVDWRPEIPFEKTLADFVASQNP